MRRMLSWFLVMLLALRGLAGDAMAMGMLPAMGADMAVPQSAMHSVHAMPVTPPTATEHASHHGMAHPAAAHEANTPNQQYAAPAMASHCDTAGAASDGADPHGNHCTTCVVCHSAVSPLALHLAASGIPAHAKPLASPARFASAQPLQACKPPIS